jgi:hypothetical protein
VSERALTWSYGGGTQSVAIAVLVAQGKLPVPECIVIADTGHERQRTWDYTQQYVEPLLATVGASIQIAPHTLATVGLFAKDGKTLIPAFAGPDSKLDTFCSNEWKKRVIRRYLRERGYGPERPVATWIGYSVDEVGRAKPSDVAWQEHRWPLLWDVPMRRHECVTLIERVGLPSPPRSSCYFCPLHGQAEWREIRDHEPSDWQKAIKYDALFYERNGVRLHRSMAPLAEADIDAPDSRDDPNQLGLIDDGTCKSGYCFV